MLFLKHRTSITDVPTPRQSKTKVVTCNMDEIRERWMSEVKFVERTPSEKYLLEITYNFKEKFVFEYLLSMSPIFPHCIIL
uniref:Uncharacterized protein n=1 Tax=Heterorhabditis bacteriophora TaxID=37862 RepID=A0A1I7XKI2_HETBA